MATVDLTTEQHRHLVRLIAESAGILTNQERQTLLDLAGLSSFKTRLQFDTDARTFAAQLVRVLQDHGTLPTTGQPALVSLLRWVREIVSGNEAEAAFLDTLLVPYPGAFVQGDAPASAALPPAARAQAQTIINYYQTIYHSGSGAVAQGQGATALGAGAVHIGGNAGGSQIVTGTGNTVSGRDVKQGGIHVGRIVDSEDVTIGISTVGETPEGILALARDFLDGNISVEEILKSKNVVVGLRHVANPQQPTLDELRAELAEVHGEVEKLLADSDDSSAEEVKQAVTGAAREASKESPDGKSIVRRLRNAAEVVVEANDAADAVKGIAGTLVKLAPAVTALLALARAYFGL